MTDLSWDDIKKRREPARATVTVCLSQEIIDELMRLDEELAEARREDRRHEGELSYTPRAKAIADKIVELEAQKADNEVEFVFQEIPRAKWNVLMRTHGPTKEQRREGITRFNPETFTPVALAASAVSPPLTDEQAKELCAEWSEGEVQRLFAAVLSANMGERHIPKSVTASEVIREHGEGSEPLSDSESPLPSSTDE